MVLDRSFPFCFFLIKLLLHDGLIRRSGLNIELHLKINVMKSYLKFFTILFMGGLYLPAQADHHPASKINSLTLDGAKIIAAAAEAEAEANNWDVVIAICDAAGNLKYLQRMEGVQLGSLAIAQEKARTAAIFRRPSKVFSDRIADGATVLMTIPNMIALEGGLPITVDGQVIGGVGVSGVRSDQDAQIAQAGIDALLKKL